MFCAYMCVYDWWAATQAISGHAEDKTGALPKKGVDGRPGVMMLMRRSKGEVREENERKESRSRR